MPTYNKLVRDEIPSIIAADGKTFRSRILDEQEYIKGFFAKVNVTCLFNRESVHTV